MLTHEITYEDFNGAQVTETLFFNLTKAELIKLQTSVPGGMQQVLQDIIDAKDVGALVREFDKILLASYGQKSEDGKRFIKNEQMREEFAASAAYDAMFSRIATDDKFAADFIIAVFPKDMNMEQIMAEAQGQLPPPQEPAIHSTPSL